MEALPGTTEVEMGQGGWPKWKTCWSERAGFALAGEAIRRPEAATKDEGDR